jgi:hypothetical protein
MCESFPKFQALWQKFQIPLFQKSQILIFKSQAKSNHSNPQETAAVLAVLGNCFTNARTDCPNSRFRSHYDP